MTINEDCMEISKKCKACGCEYIFIESVEIQFSDTIITIAEGTTVIERSDKEPLKESVINIQYVCMGCGTRYVETLQHYEGNVLEKVQIIEELVNFNLTYHLGWVKQP